jgi:hypothetical protein
MRILSLQHIQYLRYTCTTSMPNTWNTASPAAAAYLVTNYYSQQAWVREPLAQRTPPLQDFGLSLLLRLSHTCLLPRLTPIGTASPAPPLLDHSCPASSARWRWGVAQPAMGCSVVGELRHRCEWRVGKFPETKETQRCCWTCTLGRPRKAVSGQDGRPCASISFPY